MKRSHTQSFDSCFIREFFGRDAQANFVVSLTVISVMMMISKLAQEGVIAVGTGPLGQAFRE